MSRLRGIEVVSNIAVPSNQAGLQRRNAHRYQGHKPTLSMVSYSAKKEFVVSCPPSGADAETSSFSGVRAKVEEADVEPKKAKMKLGMKIARTCS